MGIKLQVPKLTDLKPRIAVIGVGGAGGNAVNNMIATGLHGVHFIVANTDAQALAASSCEQRIQLGVNLTEGLGAGSKPEIGQAAAEEAVEEIRTQIAGSHMVFIAAGMGGGTGTGAAGVIARLAKELGILTVAIVTKPFQFEGTRRMRIAEAGVEELRKYVDTLIVIPNQNLFRIANERTTFAEAFVLADQVLYSGIACIVDLIVKEGLINLDFADVRTVLAGMGTAMMGTGEASGDRRAVVAAEEAISNPLLDELTLRGAKGLLVSIIGGPDLTLYEVDEAASRVRQEVDGEANIIVGATFDDSMRDRVRVSIVASGMAGAPGSANPTPAYGHGGFPPQHAQGGHMPPAQPGQPPATRPREDLAHALSRALGTSDGGRSHVQQSPPAVGWNGPGGVMIEEGLDHLGGGHPPPLPAHGPSGPGPSHHPHQPAGFTPTAPQEIRRPPRRVPGIDEFPEVGQRDYHAKTGGEPKPRPESVPTRKLSLLERLTGLGRKPAANHPVSPSYPQAGRQPVMPTQPGGAGPLPSGSAGGAPASSGNAEQPIVPHQNIERRRR